MNYKQFLGIYNQGPEEVYRLLKTYEKRIESLSGQLHVISNRVSTLEFQSKKNSTNSHKPPSSDGLRKPKTKSLREKTDRKTGGQPGHKGHALHHVSHPDYVIQHHVKTCDGCGESLENKSVVQVKARQVFDIPPIQLEVTQHETEVKKCASCGTQTESAFPRRCTASCSIWG